MDGGTVYNIDMEGAIRQCMDLVDDESKIIVDVFVCGAEDTPPVEDDTGKAYENFMRKRTLHSYYSNTNSLATGMMAHPKVQMRYVVKQTNGFSALDELKFDGDFTWPI